ncbi:dihydropteroate synthase [candidate division KSB1 bacterium]|nr:dihydropteroate synthase [candidate division KSB1 bacterium]
MRTDAGIWQCGRYQLPLRQRTLIMGILNVTPDSFSDGGQYDHPQRAVACGVCMAAEGADIIDVGGESTRPGAEPVSEAEEKRRILPVIRTLRKKVNIPISIDTYKSGIAREAIAAGADIINDISGLTFDAQMASLAAETGVGLVIMHIKGTPRDMQKNPHYEDVMAEMIAYLKRQRDYAISAGVRKEQLAVDPGIGFGKRLQDNFTILAELTRLQALALPILIGPSRKSFIGQTLDLPPTQRLEGTAAAVTASILHGADIIRVHDVKEMKRVALIADAINRNKN